MLEADHNSFLLRFFVTCGADGDVRIWDGLDDDDPKFITVGEKVYSLALKVGHLLPSERLISTEAFCN